MKKALLFSLLIFVTISKIKAQDSLRISSRLDSFPTIKIEKNTSLLLIGIYTGAWQMGAGCNNYIIGNQKYYSNKPFKQYYDKLGDSTVLSDYQIHRKTRPFFFAGYGIGSIMFFTGVLKTIRPLYTFGLVQDSGSYIKDGHQLMIIGGVTMLASALLRVYSYAHLHKATKRYNQLITKPKTAFDIKPSQDGLGLGLRMSF
ncbi:hypothetical protein LV89_04268 [Arcicella aurantiaca]|uniref:Uncharacterized protein n=1 Tax=Arcicella aurantiaca TaxID=591202 RepID=A0A316DI25_9BACT|nr:hypothetical protein [Arcicella aurantiaca]PWK17821.1 hypothetical protein LV89_04268 [Arcicella aurantiaca]